MVDERFGHVKKNEQMILQRRQEEDEERVNRVQLGVIQAASLPVGLGNKRNSLCVTRLKTLLQPIYGKMLKTTHIIHHNRSASSPHPMLACTASFVCAYLSLCCFFKKKQVKKYRFVARHFIKAPKKCLIFICENTNMKNAV